MPIPAAITNMGISVHNCGAFERTFNNPKHPSAGKRAELTRTFRAYLELTMQSKHDSVIRGECQRLGVQWRNANHSQITHNQGATADQVLSNFYAQRAGTAADVVRDQMVTRWQRPQAEGQVVFTVGVRVDAAVQRDAQADGYRYEISYWYDGQDSYVLFHSYPA